jgi:PhnB protein
MTKINVYLNFPGNTEEAFGFYKSVFGGNLEIFRFKDIPMEGMTLSEQDGNKVMHVSLPIGDDVLMGTDALDSMGQKLDVGNNVNVSVHPESRPEADRIFGALSSGGEVEMPLADQVWGDYYGACTDKYGIHWMVNYHAE